MNVDCKELRTDSSDTFDYVLTKDADLKRPAILYSSVFGFDAKTLARNFKEITETRSDINKPIGHWTLSFHKDEKVSDKQMLQAAKLLMKKMDLERNPFVVIRHHDTEHDHCHIVFSRVGFQKELWLGEFEQKRAIVASAEIERDLNFNITDHKISSPSKRLRMTKVKKNEAEKAIRLNEMPPRVYMQKVIDNLLKASKKTPLSIREFVLKLEVNGITAVANLSKTSNKLNGFSFVNDELAFKASELNKSWGWQNMSKQLQQVTEQDIEFLRARAAREAVENSLVRQHSDEQQKKLRTVYSNSAEVEKQGNRFVYKVPPAQKKLGFVDFQTDAGTVVYDTSKRTLDAVVDHLAHAGSEPPVLINGDFGSHENLQYLLEKLNERGIAIANEQQVILKIGEMKNEQARSREVTAAGTARGADLEQSSGRTNTRLDAELRANADRSSASDSESAKRATSIDARNSTNTRETDRSDQLSGQHHSGLSVSSERVHKSANSVAEAAKTDSQNEQDSISAVSRDRSDDRRGGRLLSESFDIDKRAAELHAELSKQWRSLGEPALSVRLEPAVKAFRGKTLKARNVGGKSKTWTPDELRSELPKLIKANGVGFNVVIEPKHDKREYLIAQNKALESLQTKGFQPALVQQSGADKQGAFIIRNDVDDEHEQVAAAVDHLRRELPAEPDAPTGLLAAGFADRRPGAGGSAPTELPANPGFSDEELRAEVERRIPLIQVELVERQRAQIEKDGSQLLNVDAFNRYIAARTQIAKQAQILKSVDTDRAKQDIESAKIMFKAGADRESVVAGVYVGTPVYKASTDFNAKTSYCQSVMKSAYDDLMKTDKSFELQELKKVAELERQRAAAISAMKQQTMTTETVDMR